MGMANLLKKIFKPDNARTDAAMTRVEIGSAKVRQAYNRFNLTIDELLDKNDAVTFRGKPNAGKHR